MYLVYLNPFQGDTGPPGPPGRRGKAGRRGRTGSPGDAKVGILQKDDKCNEENTGLLRFNSTSSMKKLLFCDGENWKVSEEFVCEGPGLLWSVISDNSLLSAHVCSASL